MFRHMVRHVINYGEYADFLAALKRVNALAPSVGLPAYRAWTTAFGDLNEVWTDAEFESLDEQVKLWESARDNADFLAAFREMIAHITPGTARDYPLMPV